MNKEQQLKYDQALIVSLSDEYNRVKEVADALRNDINSLDFEERMPDSQERYLLVEKLQTTEAYQTNLHNRIRFYRHRIQVNKPQPWEVDEAIRQQDVQNRPVCGDAIDTKVESHHCGLDTRHRDEAAKKLCDLLVKGRIVVYDPGKKCNKCGGNLLEGFGTEEGGEIICFNCASQINNEELQQALDEYKAACLHHCGQDASCPVGDGSAVVNESQVPNSIKSLIGMQVIDVKGEKCDYCVTKYNAPCVKVELVGGTYLCLALLPNSIVTE